MFSVGTGFEKSSNSLQYRQARLQRRIGMMRQQRMVVEAECWQPSRTWSSGEAPSDGGAPSFAQEWFD
jgi:hypothetical protein